MNLSESNRGRATGRSYTGVPGPPSDLRNQCSIASPRSLDDSNVKREGEMTGPGKATSIRRPCVTCARVSLSDIVTVATTEETRKILPVRWKWPNGSSAERSDIASFRGQDDGYYKSDKKYAPILYSRPESRELELIREQCSLYLEDACQRTYLRNVDETKIP